MMTLVLLLGCDRTTHENPRDLEVNPVGGVLPKPSNALDTMPLTLAAMPPAALESIRKFAPTFVPFEDSSYPKPVAAAARRFGFHGLMLIRADLQGLGRVDYAVAGKDTSAFHVIALLAEADGTYRAVPVTNWPVVEGTTLSGARPLQLMRDPPCAKPCESAVIIIPLGPIGARGNERWIWAAEQRRFVLEEFPN